jgi:hypothetical protein
VNTDRVVSAVVTVADVVRLSGRFEPNSTKGSIQALERVALVTRTHGEAAVVHASAMIREAMIEPVDPSTIEWNVFRFFEAADSETEWTKWLAALLSPENGPTLSQLAWRSLCDAILAQRREATACDNEELSILATLDTWRGARDLMLPAGSVDREVADAEFGRADIVINAALYIVIENKLEAGWHDGDGDPQAVRYRKFGLKYRHNDQRLGLVLLTNRDDFELDHTCADYVRIQYRDLARALRHNLRSELSANASVVATLSLWPALLTVAAIEQDLLGIEINPALVAARTRTWRSLGRLNEILDYLQEERR